MSKRIDDIGAGIAPMRPGSNPAEPGNATLGDRIRGARLRRGLTVTGLAKAMAVSSATISHWESGRLGPNGDRMALLSSVLDVPLERLQQRIPEVKEDVTLSDIILDCRRRVAEAVNIELSRVRVVMSARGAAALAAVEAVQKQ